MRYLIIIAFVLSSGIAGPAAADLEAARQAFRQGDYSTARREMTVLAEAGDRDAQFYLGQMLAQGLDGPRDMPAAVGWFEKAAAAGHIGAQSSAGTIYAYGDGVPLDYAKALPLLTAAAEAGDATAQNNLAVLYHFGLGTRTNDAVALAWAMRAERQGMLQAIQLRREIEAVATLAQKAEAKQQTEQALPNQQPPPPPFLPPPDQGEVTKVAGKAGAKSKSATGVKSAGTPTGNRFGVQIAAVANQAAAEKQWASLIAAHAQPLNGMTPNYVPADLGDKGTVVRVVVGDYPDLNAAKQACAGFKQAGLDCLPRRY